MPGRICVAIGESTTEGAVAAISRAAAWADLVEIRADHIQDLDLGRLLRQKPCPVLFTLRSREEGGNYTGSELGRLEIIVQAARAGADYVDVEYSAFWKAVLEAVPKERVVLSNHNFEDTPSDPVPLMEAMASTGAGVLKIATRARRLSDCLRIERALKHAAERGINLCALAMGSPGIPTRIFGPRWGSWMTFASLPGESGTADGQLPADEMVSSYRIRDMGSDVRIFGVLGKPLGHSKSPLVHNAAFLARGVNAVYLPLEAADIEDFLEFDASVPIEGASVTIPFKEPACSLAHSLSVEANETGAVNTLVRRPPGWHGENTDVEGFMRPLRRRLHLCRMPVLVLGAGGAARAVVHGLRAQEAAVCVVARDPFKGKQLAERFKAEHAPWDQLQHLKWDLLVNATPVGMHPDVEQSPVPAECLTGEWVYDLVYNPRETRLLKDAASRGCKTISGMEMFIGQAMKQQQIWCGGPVPEQAMREALDKQ